MKISILLPYKENFSSNYAGAVSLFVKDTVLNSKYFKSNLYNIYRIFWVANTQGNIFTKNDDMFFHIYNWSIYNYHCT